MQTRFLCHQTDIFRFDLGYILLQFRAGLALVFECLLEGLYLLLFLLHLLGMLFVAVRLHLFYFGDKIVDALLGVFVALPHLLQLQFEDLYLDVFWRCVVERI